MNLEILIAGDPGLVSKAKRAWESFEGTLTVPFAYDRVEYSTSGEMAVSETAEATVNEDGAKIRIAPALLEAPEVDIHLVLLHESLHIAAFVGPLREMWNAVRQFTQIQGAAADLGRTLGRHLFETDAEIGLRDRYQSWMQRRAAYSVKSLQVEMMTWYADLPVSHPARPYCVLRDRLSAELAGLLADDYAVTIALTERLVPQPDTDPEVEAIYRLLSHRVRDYSTLPHWGSAAYKEVVWRVTSRLATGGV